jgi:hypothetical protein
METTMNLQQYRAIAAALNTDIVSTLAKHGLAVKPGQIGATIDPLTGAVNIRIKAADANFKDTDGNPTTPDAELFKKFAPAVGLNADLLGKTFFISGQPFTVVGWRDTRGNKPIVIKRTADGRPFLTTVESMRRHAAFLESKQTSNCVH